MNDASLSQPRPADMPSEKFSAVAWLKARPNVMRIGAVVIFFIWWEWAGRDVNPLFMTYPSAIFKAAWAMTVSGELPKAMLASSGPFLMGLSISIVGGVLIGIFIASFWFVEYCLDPFLNALYAIPRVALVPLIILWAGLETTGKVTIIVSLAIFPVIINTYSGIKDVRGGLIEIGRAYGATEMQIFQKIILPASVPYIMAGIRLAVGLGIIGIIVAEFFTAITGLGGLIVFYSNNFATAKLFVPVIVIGILGIALTQLIAMLEKKLSGWRISERERF